MSSHFVVLATLALAILFSPETLVLGLVLSSDKKVPREAAYAFAIGAVLGITFATSIGLWIAHASGAVSAPHADHPSWPGFVVRIVIAGALLVIGLYRAMNAIRHKPIPDVTKADHHPGRLRTSLSQHFPKLMHSLDPEDSCAPTSRPSPWRPRSCSLWSCPRHRLKPAVAAATTRGVTPP